MPIRSATVARTTPAHARTRRHIHSRAAMRHARARASHMRPRSIVRWHRPARPAAPPHTRARIAATHLKLDDDVLSPSASSSESMATPASRAAMEISKHARAWNAAARARPAATTRGCGFPQAACPGGHPTPHADGAAVVAGSVARLRTAACVRARLPAIASAANPTRGTRITACGRISTPVFRLGRDLTPWVQ